jgi:DNA-directed RNA polymerase specialized sigma24 family protein
MDFLNESDRKACLEIIWKVVETLEPAQRNLADLYYRQGKSVTQIAITLGSARKPKPQGTVKTLLNRLRKAIRRGVVEMDGATTLPHEPMQA